MANFTLLTNKDFPFRLFILAVIGLISTSMGAQVDMGAGEGVRSIMSNARPAFSQLLSIHAEAGDLVQSSQLDAMGPSDAIRQFTDANPASGVSASSDIEDLEALSHGEAAGNSSPLMTLKKAAGNRITMGALMQTNYLGYHDTASDLVSNFSQTSFGGPMYEFEPSLNVFDFTESDQMIAFAEANSMEVNGGALVWGQGLPEWLINPQTPWTPTSLNEVIHNYITTLVSRYKGRASVWTVNNEGFDVNGNPMNDLWTNWPGIGFAHEGTKTIEQEFMWAHEADPSAKLFYNDNLTASESEPMEAKFNGIYSMAEDFVNRKVPLSGIGIEMHITPAFDNPITMASFKRIIHKFGSLGLEVSLSEVDVRIPTNSAVDLSVQAHVYSDLLKLCMGEPSCKTFFVWGISDNESWDPAGYPLLFDNDNRKKPAYFSIINTLETTHVDVAE